MAHGKIFLNLVSALSKILEHVKVKVDNTDLLPPAITKGTVDVDNCKLHFSFAFIKPKCIMLKELA